MLANYVWSLNVRDYTKFTLYILNFYCKIKYQKYVTGRTGSLLYWKITGRFNFLEDYW